MEGRILITGDKHGSFRSFFGLKEHSPLYESDILIITGDASYVWDSDYINKITTLKQLFPGTVAFIDGNHENHEILSGLPVSVWNGGKVHQIGDRVFHLMRGEIYTIRGKKFFALGGARYAAILDKQGEEGKDWWSGEEPDKAELEYAERNFIKNLDSINYVITHEGPLAVRSQIKKFKPIPQDYKLPDVLNNWYNEIHGKSNFKKWYFGHLHTDIDIDCDLTGIHNYFIDIDTGEKLYWR